MSRNCTLISFTEEKESAKSFRENFIQRLSFNGYLIINFISREGKDFCDSFRIE